MILRTLRNKEKEAVLEFLETRFGIEKSVFSGMEFLDNGKGRVFILGKTAAGFAVKEKIACISLPFVRLEGKIKPTSVMIQSFGKHVKKNVLTLGKQEAKEFTEGFDLTIKNHGCSDGYVILRYKDYSLGCGLLKGNNLKNMLPKAKRMPVEFL